MPRGESPNSRENLKRAYNGRGGFDTETARKAKEKSDESKANARSLTETLKELCTDDRKKKMIDRLIVMAEHGNLKALQIILRYLGEDPEIELKRAELELKKAQAEQKDVSDTDRRKSAIRAQAELWAQVDEEMKNYDRGDH